jgi:2-oxoglutarate ferredoxin oxidoreductase subunit delta
VANELKKSRQFYIEVDGQACKECGYCMEVCPRNVFSPADYFNDKGHKPVKIKSSEKCIGCRMCFFVCPDFAINVEEKQAEEGSV